ncbi:hypothetical protein Pmani_014847 [Petrolisthes manimaculis]|uniref:Uncharacterized protein n=1 Tax=Petrolisthes manimaculis TaxID=1843537 RepID=A0AAE1PT52_9EUCA|nr:hypothetical protein Pmani_014847 [Petrolisthes manimaculis]
MEDTRTYFLFPDVLCLLTWVVDCYRLPLDNLNLRPVIGVLAQHPPDNRLVDLEDHNFTSYITASYVKHLESTKARNRLDASDDMRVALSKKEPRFSIIVEEKQQQKSH